MPRPERSLDDAAGPVQLLAAQLRALRLAAGNPGYRELAELAGYSAATLANAAGGRRLPSLVVTLAFVRACGGDEAVWEGRWRQAAAEETALRAGASPAPGEPGAGEAPYLGLAGYGVEDADRFFGRGRLVAQLVELLERQLFMAVFGVSGSGKSSLLRAGLVPALCGNGPERSDGSGPRGVTERPDGAGGYVPVLMTPGAHPVAALREELSRVPPGRAALVVVDQFEEVFTQCREEAERTSFVTELAALVDGSGGRAQVVVGVRADFYARCADLPGLAELMAGANLPVGPLSDGELREVITGPARLAGLTVERALVIKILADASGQPGALPLVSHALLETWRQRRADVLTVAGYEAAGGVAGAIAQTAEAVYTGFDTDQRETTRRVLLRLVTFGEGVEDTRRRVERTELDLPRVAEILDRLAAARLVTLGEETAEIAHEALLRAWPRLRQWLSTDRERLRVHRQLTDAAQTWVALHHDPGSLYRGARLEAAREWASAGELNRAERAFLDASVELRERERTAATRRSRQLRYLAAGLAVLLLIVTGVSVVAVQQRRDAVHARQVAISRQLAIQALASADSDPATAMLLSVQAYRIAATVEARGALLSMSAHGAYHGTLSGHTGAVSQVAFAPDGHTLFSVGRDQSVGVWDVRQHRRLATLTGHHTWLKAIALSPDGRMFATGGDDHDIALWQAANRKRVATLSGHTAQIKEIAFSPDSRILATASADTTIILWDLAHRTRLATLSGHTSTATGVAFSPDSRILATTGEDATVSLWDIASGARLATLPGHTRTATAVAFSPDGATLASAGGDTTVILWDVAQRTRLATLTHGRIGDVISLKFSPDGRTLATAGTDSTVLLWDTRYRTLRARLTGHYPNIYTVDFSPHGNLLASAGEGGAITIWDTTQAPLATSTAGFNDVAFSPDGRLLADASAARSMVWNTDNRAPQAVLAHANPVNAVAFSPDGHLLAAATGPDRQPPTTEALTLWDLTAHTDPVRLEGHTDRVLDAAFSPDGRIVATTSVDKTVILWDVAKHARLATLTGHTQPVNGVTFSPDGRTLATAGHDPAVMLWDVERHTKQATLTGHTGWVRTVAFSPDGATLATSDSDQTVIVWDVARRTRLATITDHADAMSTGVAFSPDGATLAYTSADNTVVLWDLTSRTPKARLTGHTGPIRAIAFSPDGATLATASADQTIILWNTNPHQATTRICDALTQNLTAQQWKQLIPDLPYTTTCTTTTTTRTPSNK